MDALLLLRRLASALLRHGLILAPVADDLWAEWGQQCPPARRHEVLTAVAALGDSELATVVADVAGNVAPEDRERLAETLAVVVARLRVTLEIVSEVRSSLDLLALLAPAVQPGPRVTVIEPVSVVAAVPSVTLVGIKGIFANQRFTYRSRTLLLVGRESDCSLRLPDDDIHQYFSRHHSLLDIAPPKVRIRDLGSKAGTYINDQLLGKRPDHVGRTEAAALEQPECELRHGDTFHLGRKANVAFRVEINAPAPVVPPPPVVVPTPRVTIIEPDSVSNLTSQPVTGTCMICARVSTDSVCADCQRIVADSGLLGDSRLPPAIGKYRILERLGKGGAGAVYLGVHERSGTRVAVKVVLPEAEGRDSQQSRLLREIEILRSLDHTHVVRILDRGMHKGGIYLVLELCQQGSVADLLDRCGGKLPVDEAVTIAIQALRAIEYAHSREHPVIHRDLKPGNLLLHGVGCDRLVKIADFGLAKALDDAGLTNLTKSGDRCGTLLYMPRRQVTNFKNLGPDADLWSLAATLYHLLTGHPPRDFNSRTDPWMTVLESPAMPILQRNPSLPPSLAEVIDRALLESPPFGYPTARAFREALEDA